MLGVDVGEKANGASGLLTRRQLADKLGVHPMSIKHWQDDGCPVAKRGSSGVSAMFRLEDVERWRYERAGRGPSAVVALSVERARKERAQAAEAEQRYQIRAGKFVDADDVERMRRRENERIKRKLEAVPPTYAARIHRAATLGGGEAAVERELEAVVKGVLRELADD
jgi:phage terminase Nu1 subunit (DNA packaging protein)